MVAVPHPNLSGDRGKMNPDRSPDESDAAPLGFSLQLKPVSALQVSCRILMTLLCKQ